MNAIVRSSGMFGQMAKKHLEKQLNIKVDYFAEPVKLSKQQSSICGIPVISQYRAAELYKSGKIDKYVIPGTLKVKSMLELENELNGFGIAPEDIIVIPSDLIEKKEWNNNQCEYVKRHHEFRYLNYLEFHVADHCNLKCRNCTHYSPLVQSETFADFETVKNDFIILKKFVDNIGTIRILGGECLLNPELGEYIPMVKQFYPYSDLDIVTNGILVRNMSDDLVNILLKYGVEVNLSAYPPMFHRIDEITDFMERRGIRYNVLGPIFNFSKILDLDNKVEFPFRHTNGQWGCGCYNLYMGKISICPMVCYSFYYDKFYGKDELVKLSKKGIIALDKITSFANLKSSLQSPCDLCDHCLLYRSKYDEDLQVKWKI